METENQLLKDRIVELETELASVKEQLKKYTAPARSKTYYENHKEEIKKRKQEQKERIGLDVSAEIIRERNRKAYLKRKEKLAKENK
jgi:hypothetical protein